MTQQKCPLWVLRPCPSAPHSPDPPGKHQVGSVPTITSSLLPLKAPKGVTTTGLNTPPELENNHEATSCWSRPARRIHISVMLPHCQDGEAAQRGWVTYS